MKTKVTDLPKEIHPRAIPALQEVPKTLLIDLPLQHPINLLNNPLIPRLPRPALKFLHAPQDVAGQTVSAVVVRDVDVSALVVGQEAAGPLGGERALVPAHGGDGHRERRVLDLVLLRAPSGGLQRDELFQHLLGRGVGCVIVPLGGRWALHWGRGSEV
jgi:hypothetical protein